MKLQEHLKGDQWKLDVPELHFARHYKACEYVISFSFLNLNLNEKKILTNKQKKSTHCRHGVLNFEGNMNKQH